MTQHASLAFGAYKSAMLATSDARSIEAEAFEKLNADLRRVESGRSSDFPAYVSALSRNLNIWTILAADVASDGNALPLETRSSIWKLAAFVRTHTRNLLQANSSERFAPLIEINAHMIAGLRKSVARPFT